MSRYSYRGYRYRSWRSRGWSSNPPSKFSVLTSLFGNAVNEIKVAFFHLEPDALNELMSDYGAIHGQKAEKYARNTYPKWKYGSTMLSGQTMERLVALVPPYLTPQQRYSLLQSVLKRHRKSSFSKTIRVNMKEPAQGLSEAQQALDSMSHEDILAHIPENVMKAANWLYDDDITASRAMISEIERRENDIIRASATREIELLKKTILTGQIKSANYSVEMPYNKLNIIAYTPSMCFIATACFGESARETKVLRDWRDTHLVESEYGRRFIVWYYRNGENLSAIISRSKLIKIAAKTTISLIANIIQYEARNE